MKNYFVYIIANKYNTVIYIGVTNNLERRIYEHKNKLVDGFSKRYNLTKLVYFEQTTDVNAAIISEKEIKKWRREKKDNLIESLNPEWKDLIEDDKGKISQSNKKDILLRNDKNVVISIPMKSGERSSFKNSNDCDQVTNQQAINKDKISQSKNTFLRNDKQSITGLIIAAGLSSRMGKFKPLLKWKDKSFLTNIIDKLKPICNEIIIVTGNKTDLIEQHVNEYYSNVESIKCVFNSNYENGMFTSLKKGIENSGISDWVLYHQVDQPNLPSNFYNDCIENIESKYDWIQPCYQGKNGHPVIFNRKIMDLIKIEKPNGNLRDISRSDEIKKKYWECNYSEIHTDIDTLKDLEKLKREEND